MAVFLGTLDKIGFLFTFIIIGYILGKIKAIPENSRVVLSKMENVLFVPALVLLTFANDFTLDKFKYTGSVFISSAILVIITIPIMLFVSKTLSKDRYEQNIYSYGLIFANFGFMGNAVVEALFPEIFLEYITFTLPGWIAIYLWAVPNLLIGGTGNRQNIKERMKALCNPMFIAMIIGAVLGLTGIKMPGFLEDVVSSAKACMSPVAMLLTGITISTINLKKTFTDGKVYLASIIRLVIVPLIFLIIAPLLKLDDVTFKCALCFISMPLGLNTVVIPGAYGKDTSKAAGMALISHGLSALTIPVIFMLAAK